MTPMTPLRQRMIQDMQIRNLSPRTIECYTDHVGCFAKHFGRAPEVLGMEEVRTYQVYLVQEKKVACGKGAKERLVPLSPRLLDELRGYWKVVRPARWLFPGGAIDRPISDTTVQKSCKRAAREAGIAKHVSPHVLRHSYATGLMESGVDLLTISRLLGHRSFSTTLVYLHVRRPHLERTVSPLDLLPVEQCPRFAEPAPLPSSLPSPRETAGFQPLVPESDERTDSPEPAAAPAAAPAS